MKASDGFDFRAHELLNKTIAFAALLAPDGTVRDVSENALTAAGISLESVKGRFFWDGYWFSHDVDLQGRIRSSISAAASGSTERFDFPARIVNDGRLHVDYQIAPIRDTEGQVVELLASGFDVTEREVTKKHLELALRDSSHRIKNIFTTVRAMAHLTRRHASPETAMDEFLSRFEALATAHHVLSSSEQAGFARFGTIADAILRPYLGTDRTDACIITGGDRRLARDRAKLLALCLHELTTNAVKYGALSKVGGGIRIALSDPDPSGIAEFRWEETFASPVQPTNRIGFGTQFIEITLQDTFGSHPRFERSATGLSVEVRGVATDLFETTDEDFPPSRQT